MNIAHPYDIYYSVFWGMAIASTLFLLSKHNDRVSNGR